MASNQSNVTNAAEMRITERVSDALSRFHGNAAAIKASLQSLQDRLFGVRPEEAVRSTEAPPQSFEEALGQEIDRLDSVLLDIYELSSRLVSRL